MKKNLKLFGCMITGLAALSLMTSCGGGGGGGGSVSGAAFVRIDALPRSIDSGDRTGITIDIRDIHENGISLKIKFPSDLSFVESSAEIFPDGDDEYGIAPDVLNASESDTYLVFYLDGSDFGDDERGQLFFELQGRASVEEAVIEVDPDVDDPLVDNAIEFNVEEPQFEAEDETFVEVRG